jgi:Fic family protein
MGLDIGALPPIDRNVEGIVEVILDATRNYAAPLATGRLFDWHAALFPTGRSGIRRITIGGWRTGERGARQVVSGQIGQERVHYEAPGHARLKSEMARFIKWCTNVTKIDPVIKSAVAHFWFVTIHPFEDGNGRIARAIADLLLSRSEKSPQRFYSLSAQIHRERQAYYAVLEKCQKGTLDITAWVEWFLHCLKRALASTDHFLESVLVKAHFWQTHTGETFNDRQGKVLNRLLDGFTGKLTSSKWAKVTKCSSDTALRDISDLLARKILTKAEAGGRSTSYELQIPKQS